MKNRKISLVLIIAGAFVGLLAIVKIMVAAPYSQQCASSTLLEGGPHWISTQLEGEAPCWTNVPPIGGNLEIHIHHGYVFTAPLKLNGNVVETSMVPGELAPQIQEFSIELTSGENLLWEPKSNLDGTEMGFLYSLKEVQEEPTSCQHVSLGYVQDVMSWNWDAPDFCLETTWESDGIVDLQGWVFTSPLKVNGSEIETYQKPGELAMQIAPFSQKVKSGETWLWEVTPEGNNLAELGLNINYRAEVFKLYFPVVIKPAQTTITTRQVVLDGNLQILQVNWPNAQPGQEFKLYVEVSNATANSLLESGWFFGHIKEIKVNGNPVNFETTPENPPQAGTIHGPNAIPYATVIEIVIKATNTVPEIGIRLR
jgi:hypothetical protein